MKKIQVLHLLNWQVFFLFGAIAFFLTSQLKGQTTPPPVEYNYQTPGNHPAHVLDDNWALTPLQASDGSIIIAGFSDKYNNGLTGIRCPSLSKFYPGPKRRLAWEVIPTEDYPSLGITVADNGRGGFIDLFESNEGGTKYIYTCGYVSEDASSGGSGQKLPVLAKFYLSTGQMVYFKVLTTNMYEGVAYRMKPFYKEGILTSIFLVGNTVAALTNPETPAKAILYNCNLDGTLNTGFDTDGMITYSAISPLNDNPTFFQDIVIDPADNNIIAVGSILISGAWNTQKIRDAWALKISSSDGSKVWEKKYEESALIGSSLYTDLNQSTEVAKCDDSGGLINLETQSEEAYSAKILPDGKLAILCRFDFAEIPLNLIPSCLLFNTEQYFDYDNALLKVNPSTGNVLYAIDAGRTTAIDGWPVMVNDCNDIYICGNYTDDVVEVVNGIEYIYRHVLASVMKVSDNGTSFTNKWRKNAKGSDNYLCTFGISLTPDKGVFIVGNNAIQGDNYEYMKLSYDGPSNLSYDQSGTNITTSVTWNSPKKVKGIITVKSGGTLTISNTTIQFANSYQTNDFTSLYGGTGVPTKIIVEPNGKLILDNAILKGITISSTCGESQRESMWEGITVLGNTALSATTANQGYVAMTNNAQILDAYIGVLVGNSSYNIDGISNPTESSGGGILSLRNTTPSSTPHFYNCRRSIHYSPYPKISGAYNSLSNINFICDRPMLDANIVDELNGGSQSQGSFVTVYDRGSIAFSGCKFISRGNTSPSLGGTGISTIDGKITLRNCTFQLLYKGIYAEYIKNITAPITMYTSTVDQVRRGVHIVGGAFHNFEGNTFSNISGNILNDDGFGLRTEGATNLTVQKSNTFSSSHSNTYGVIFKDSYEMASVIKDNTYTGSTFGTQSEQNNQGLQVRCNSYNSNQKAWSINPLSTPNTSGLFPNQGAIGSSSTQAGNLFLTTDCPGGVAESHIKSNIDFEYAARTAAGSDPNERPTCYSNGPAAVSGFVTILFTTSGTQSPYRCPAVVKDPDGPVIANNYIKAGDAASGTWNKEYLYNVAVSNLLEREKMDSALLVLDTKYPDNKELYIGALIGLNDFALAQTELNSKLTLSKYSDIKRYFQILIDRGGSSFFPLSYVQFMTLDSLTTSNTITKYLAQNTLALLNSVEFERLIEKWPSSSFLVHNETKEVKDASYLTGLIINPNPTTGQFNVTWDPKEGMGEIKVYDMAGKTLFSQSINTEQGFLSFDLSKNGKGIYIIHMTQGNESLVNKVIVLE